MYEQGDSDEKYNGAEGVAHTFDILGGRVTLLSGSCSSRDEPSDSGPPDVKATDRAANPTPTPLPVAKGCPTQGAPCEQALQLASQLARGDYQAIADQIVPTERTCTEPIPMVLEPRCQEGSTGASVEGASYVLGGKATMFLPVADFKQKLLAVFGATPALNWHVAAVGCPGKTPAPDCSHTFAVVVVPDADYSPIALVYTTERAAKAQLIGAEVLLPDSPALRGGVDQLLYLDRDTASNSFFWFMPWEPKPSS